ncbi:MAG: LLM class flavin-dependent oxidoreductase [Blastocatellia bacterium]
MKIGTSLNSAYFVKDPRQCAAFMVEQARAARQAGLDSLFVGDHHVVPVFYYQNTPILGSLLAEWYDRPAGCLFLLPLWNPVLVAEQVGTLAAIAPGRFIFQCALGEGEQQFAATGATLRTRPSAFEESFSAIKRLLSGEIVSCSGRFHFEKAKIKLIPAEPVEYWIGADAEPAIDRAARLGDGWMAGPGSTFEDARRRLDHYRDRCAAHGRTPTAVAIRRDIYVGETDAEAEEAARKAIDGGYRGFSREMLVAGSAGKVINEFRRFEEAGFTDMIVRHFNADQSKVLASMERLAAVRQALNA